MIRRSLLPAVISAFLVMGFTAHPALAKGPMAALAIAELACSLPEFPTPGNTTTCSGTGVGGTAFVDDKGDPGVFVAAGPVSSKKVLYFEPCTAGEPITGFATGSLEGQGTWFAQKNGPLGHPAHVWIPFNWVRVGLIAVVTTGKLSGKGNTTITDKITGQTAQDAAVGVAAASLIPLGVPGNCTNPAPLDILTPSGGLGA